MPRTLSEGQLLKYVPYSHSQEVPNIIVDGEANTKTVLTLSHWPNSTTPQDFQDDLSAQIVFNFLTSDAASKYAQWYGPDLAVSNNHFDEDGLVGLFAMVEPDEALMRREFLIDVAAAGDFGVYRDRDAARVAFVISAWTRESQSPLNAKVFQSSYLQFTNVLYEELLPRLPKIIDKLINLAKFWQEEDEFLDLTEEAIASKKITIREFREIDLAVVEIPLPGIVTWKEPPPYAMSWISSVCHPMAVHNATDCMRILVMQGQQYELYYRYETWVDYRSRKLVPRVELHELARTLTNEELGMRIWTFDGVDQIVPRLKIKGEKNRSSVPPDQLIVMLKDYFAKCVLEPSREDLLF